MPNTTSYLEDLGIIETKYSGIPTLESLEITIQECFRIAREKSTFLFLGDCTELSGGGSPLDMYQMARMYEEIPESRLVKEAIILPISDKGIEDMKFYETTTRNRGFNVRLFNNRQTAIDWLKE